MNTPSEGNIEAIFTEALELPAALRQAYLDRACADNDALRKKVEGLLRQSDSCNTAIFRQAAGLAFLTTPVEALPVELGRYRLEERIGEGSFGVVYRATQHTPVHRTVAIKVLRPGFDSGQIINRFNSERQALAQMDHPNIAKILDGGSTDAGRPYFVMEYVAGTPITHFADENRLPIDKRLGLFMQVCDAISHAHTKAIVHRDIKASNVLAYYHDGKPTVKVIDFGIAKALTSERPIDWTGGTIQGHPIGTFAYMSPEQAMGQSDTDTRTDVYSLGVLLYELLAGAKPFDERTFAKAPEHEIRRLLCEADPPKPSARLSTLDEASTQIAAARQTNLTALSRDLRNELEWIPLMAMRKERDRRYGSVRELAEDIRNYLNHRPLVAGPESRRYRLRKYLLRNKVPVVAAVVVVLALLLGIIGTSWEAWRAVRAEQSATSLAKSEAEQRHLAEKNERVANIQLVSALNSQAESMLTTNQHDPAAELLLKADSLARKLGAPNLRGDLLSTNLLLHVPPTLYTNTSIRSLAQHIRLLSDQRTLVTGDEKDVVLIDLMSGVVRRRLSGHTEQVTDVAVSPDGRMIASCDNGGTLVLWSYPLGILLQKLKVFKGQLFSVAFSPRDPIVAVTSSTGMMRIDINNPTNIRSRDMATTVQSVDFTPDGSTILISGNNGTWRQLDAANLTEKVASPSVDLNARAIACDPSGSQVFVGTDRGIMKCALPSGQQLAFFSCPAAIRALAISSSGTMVVAACADHAVRLFDISTAQLLRTFEDNFDGAHGLLFCAEDSVLLCAAIGDVPRGGLRAWSLSPRQYLSPICSGIEPKPHPSGALSASSDSRLALTAGPGQDATVWDLATGMTVGRVRGHTRSFQFVAFTDDQSGFYSVDDDGLLTEWNLSRMTPIATRQVAPTNPSSFAVGTKNRTYAVSIKGGPLEVRQMQADRVVYSYPTTQWAETFISSEFSQDGSRLVSNTDFHPRIFDLAKGREIVEFNEASRVLGTMSSDASTLLLGYASGSIERRLLSNGKRTLVPRHIGPIQSLSASADGAVLATGGQDRAIALTDPNTLELLAFIREFPASVDQLLVSPNSKHLLALSDSQLISIDLNMGHDYLTSLQNIDEARNRLQLNPDDPQALMILGLHDVQCCADSWAIELLTRARDLGADVPSLPLARSYWRLHRLAQARREFQLAIQRKEAPEPYLRLCLNAIDNPPATTEH